MFNPKLLALVGAFALSACQLDIVGPGPGAGTGPTIDPRPTEAVMRDACSRAAQDQGVAVVSIGRFQTVTGSGGREIGTTTMMRVAGGGQTFDVRCSYSFGDDLARITLA
jgi:hypothetical protein